jgi:hypothetical protein
MNPRRPNFDLSTWWANATDEQKVARRAAIAQGMKRAWQEGRCKPNTRFPKSEEPKLYARECSVGQVVAA